MAKKTPNSTPKPKSKPNSSILNFFKTENLFVHSKQLPSPPKPEQHPPQDDLWEGNAPKRRKLSYEHKTSGHEESTGNVLELEPQIDHELFGGKPEFGDFSPVTSSEAHSKVQRRSRIPFLEESESDSDAAKALPLPVSAAEPKPLEPLEEQVEQVPPSTADFEEFEGLGDFEDDILIPEEQLQGEEGWLDQEGALKLEGDGSDAPLDMVDLYESDNHKTAVSGVPCPICGTSLAGMNDDEASVHVNHCLDHGGPSEAGSIKPDVDQNRPTKSDPDTPSAVPLSDRFIRPPRPGQKDPFTLSRPSATKKSAFSKIMSANAEDVAWKTAAAAEVASRGKQSYERTCPFYKIMPGLSITVDAFRYGSVEGCQAYFLSHFHSDHYIGLTSTWCHGPIYCSRVTANLVKQQLRVVSKWVVPLDFEREYEVANTPGVKVTMISANHCPGSSLFLFEKPVGNGLLVRVQRILHCGDFRACTEHLEHPLLKPDVQDRITGQARQQRIDICYLDTTYLNPKYAFPKQSAVIKACADVCVQLNSSSVSDVSLEREGGLMKSFLKSRTSTFDLDSSEPPTSRPPRLLVVVGTYSIGKERICIGIAKALNSKIYAPPNKMRICACLEDVELSSLLVSDPRAAQVHMTPVFEIRSETLDEYLSGYTDTFTHVAGFRPTGWTYRPPNTRFLESPSVSTVLHGENWMSGYSVKDLQPQRGSTKRAACYGVPYSEHSSFRELTAFCCALRIVKIVPTVNVGSAKSREKMRTWVDRWDAEKKKNGLFDPNCF